MIISFNQGYGSLKTRKPAFGQGEIAIFEIEPRQKASVKQQVCERIGVEHSPHIFSGIFTPQALKSELSPQEINKIQIMAATGKSKMDAAVLNMFPNLKMIAIQGAGIDNVDMEACKQRNIAVKNVPSYGEHTIAEFTMGLLSDVTRKITMSNNLLKKGIVNITDNEGDQLYGKTLAVIGPGKIGSNVAKIAKGYGMEVIGYSPNYNINNEKPEYKDLRVNHGIKFTNNLDEVLQKADAITINASYKPGSPPILDKKAFDTIRNREKGPGIYIANVGRGGHIDHKELLSALNDGTVKGAGLDVLVDENIIFENQPVQTKSEKVTTSINKKLLNHPHVVITPHTAYNSVTAKGEKLKISLDNIINFFQANLIQKGE